MTHELLRWTKEVDKINHGEVDQKIWGTHLFHGIVLLSHEEGQSLRSIVLEGRWWWTNVNDVTCDDHNSATRGYYYNLCYVTASGRIGTLCYAVCNLNMIMEALRFHVYYTPSSSVLFWQLLEEVQSLAEEVGMCVDKLLTSCWVYRYRSQHLN